MRRKSTRKRVQPQQQMNHVEETRCWRQNLNGIGNNLNGITEMPKRISAIGKSFFRNRRADLYHFCSRPLVAMSTLLVYIAIFWLSLKQVRYTFRLLAFSRLLDILRLRNWVESYICLVLLVMIVFYMCLDLAMLTIVMKVITHPFKDIKDMRGVVGTSSSTSTDIRKNPPRACKKDTPYRLTS